MKKFRTFFILMALVFTILGKAGYADELADLKAQMEELKTNYETKIKELESKIEAISQKQEEKVAQLAEKVDQGIPHVDYVGRHKALVGNGGLVVKNPFGFGSVSLGGYFDTEYHDFEDTDSTFRQHRWIINIGAELAERLRFNSELEIEYGGPNTPGTDGEVKVEQAFGDYLINDGINLRLGALLVPFGRYNLTHDSDLQNLTDRPIVAKDIVPTTWTEAGAGFFGNFHPTIGTYEGLALNYELYAVNGLDAGFSDTGLSGARNSLKTDNNKDKAVVGRLAVSPWMGQEIGLSAYNGEYDTSGNNITGQGFDWLSTFGPVEVLGEYAHFSTDESATDVSNFFHGYYTQVNYEFWPQFLSKTFLGRGFADPKLTLIGQYDWAEIADDGDAGIVENNEEDRWTLGLNYRPIDSFVFKFEYQWNHAKNEALERGDSNGFVTSVAMGF